MGDKNDFIEEINQKEICSKKNTMDKTEIAIIITLFVMIIVIAILFIFSFKMRQDIADIKKSNIEQNTKLSGEINDISEENIILKNTIELYKNM